MTNPNHKTSSIDLELAGEMGGLSDKEVEEKESYEFSGNM